MSWLPLCCFGYLVPAIPLNTIKLFPAVEPYQRGMLDVGDGHKLYWERVGVHGGRAAIALHGGPGGSATPLMRQLFDPDLFDLLLFDQRGCGRSTACDPLYANTTQDLVKDIDRLRTATSHADKSLVFGGSWGSLLALAYAEARPEAVDALVLRGIFMGSAAEMEWFYGSGLRNMFPDKWEKFISIVEAEDQGNMLEAYYKLLISEDIVLRTTSVNAWCTFEEEISVMDSSNVDLGSMQDDERRLRVATMQAHYFLNKCFLRENQLIDNVACLSSVPDHHHSWALRHGLPTEIRLGPEIGLAGS